MVSSHLGNEAGRPDGILVPREGACEEAVALFIAKDKAEFAALFKFFYFLSDIFKAGESLYGLDTVSFGHLPAEIAGNNGFDHDRIGRQRFFPGQPGQDIVQQQGSDLVAGKVSIAAAVSANGAADTVTIGICGQDNIRLFTPGQLQGHLKSLRLFGVGNGHGAELRVGNHLLLHQGQVDVAAFAQQIGNMAGPSAVQRRVDKLQPCLRPGERKRPDRLAVRAVYLRADNPEQACALRLFPGNNPHIVKEIHPRYGRCNFIDERRNCLSAVGAIDLVTVILRRIVAGRDHDPGGAAQFAHGKGKLRRRADAVKEKRGDAVGCKDQGGINGKFAGEAPRIAGDGHLFIFCLQIQAVKVVSQPLRRPPHDIAVHPVQPGADNAAHPPGPESQLAAKAAGYFVAVAGHGLQLAPRFRIQVRAFQPPEVTLLRGCPLPRRRAAEIICVADDIIFPEIAAVLHLYHLQQLAAGILQAVLRPGWYEDAFTCLAQQLFLPHGNQRPPPDHDPVFRAVAVALQAEPLSRFHGKPFHLVTLARLQRSKAPPGTVDGAVMRKFGGTALFQRLCQLPDFLGAR